MKYFSRDIRLFLIVCVLMVLPSFCWANAQGVSDGMDVDKWSNMVSSLCSWGMWKLLLGGLKTTLTIFVFAAIGSVILGALLAYLDISKRCAWFFKPFNWFVTTVHDIPSVALMMFFYYVVFGGKMNAICVTVIALSVYVSESLTDIFKSNVQYVGKGQIEAGLMLGLTRKQCLRYIVLPQAVKAMLPSVTAQMKLLLRITSYAGYLAQEDLIKAVYSVRAQYSDTFLPLIIVSVMYLVISWFIAKILHLFYVKFFRI